MGDGYRVEEFERITQTSVTHHPSPITQRRPPDDRHENDRDADENRGDEGVERIKQLTNGVGADSVLECVGTQESMLQAIKATRPGGYVGYVGVPHGVSLDGQQLFFSHVHLHGGPAPVRKYLPKLIDLVFKGTINPGKVFDLVLPLAQVAEGYRAMDERRAIKTLLQA